MWPIMVPRWMRSSENEIFRIIFVFLLHACWLSAISIWFIFLFCFSFSFSYPFKGVLESINTEELLCVHCNAAKNKPRHFVAKQKDASFYSCCFLIIMVIMRKKGDRLFLHFPLLHTLHAILLANLFTKMVFFFSMRSGPFRTTCVCLKIKIFVLLPTFSVWLSP